MTTNAEHLRLQDAVRFLEPDTSINADLENIVNLAAHICNVPIAMVTIMDEHTQWFKASKGVNVNSNVREHSFCRYTIQQNEVLVVEDAQLDERFKNYPHVAGAPHIKFYAGANLTTRSGYHAGTLCVLDVVPKALTHEQQNALQTLAKQVINLMELSYSLRALDIHYEEALRQKQIVETSEIQLKACFDSTRDMFILLSKSMDVLSFNKSAERYIRQMADQELTAGTPIAGYFEAQTNKEIKRHFNKALKGRDMIREWKMNGGNGKVLWMETYFMPVRKDGDIVAVAINASDITLRKIGEEQLRIKNEALQHIAIIQSHEIRRPVASLLGLIELIKTEHQDAHQQFAYFDMIEAVVQELDTKIHAIVHESEFTLNVKASLF